LRAGSKSMIFKRYKRYLLAVLALPLAIIGLAAWLGGGSLVVDSPERSDVILVLAGETNRRPEKALKLLQEGYGQKMILDVPAAAKVFNFTELELAEKYKESSPLASRIVICSIEGLSTRDEAHDVEKCLTAITAQSVLIVTSDFHTRRSLSVFRRVIPERTFSTAAAYDDTQFGPRWWTRRQWAKTMVDEGLKWIWWEVVDRWR
jgi:hypothetical protein